jgi:hypothetical protein
VTGDDGTHGNGDNRNEAGINVSRVIKNMVRVGRKLERMHGY